MYDLVIGGGGVQDGTTQEAMKYIMNLTPPSLVLLSVMLKEEGEMAKAFSCAKYLMNCFNE